jgi:hypothetical protein
MEIKRAGGGGEGFKITASLFKLLGRILIFDFTFYIFL